MSKTILVAAAVSKVYYAGSERLAALQNASATLYEQELVAIVGASGSGKTTLAHILGGLLKPDSGKLTFKNAFLALRHNDAALSRYRNKYIGFVFQDFNLINRYNVLDNVALPLIIAGVKPTERKQRALQCLKQMGLEQRAASKVAELSGGERQRVALARALAHNPSVIIADEPTGSLDSTNGHHILDLLRTLVTEHGVTVVMITHDTQLARAADRIIHIKDGAIIAGAAQ